MFKDQIKLQILELVSEFGLNPKDYRLQPTLRSPNRVHFRLIHQSTHLTFGGEAIATKDHNFKIDTLRLVSLT